MYFAMHSNKHITVCSCLQTLVECVYAPNAVVHVMLSRIAVSKYFLYNYSSFVLFHCDFTNTLIEDITSVYVILGFWVTSQYTVAVYRHNCRASENFSKRIFWMLSNICFKHWINIIYACIAQIEKIYVDFNNINNQTIFSKPGKPRWKYNAYFFIHI